METDNQVYLDLTSGQTPKEVAEERPINSPNFTGLPEMDLNLFELNFSGY